MISESQLYYNIITELLEEFGLRYEEKYIENTWRGSPSAEYTIYKESRGFSQDGTSNGSTEQELILNLRKRLVYNFIRLGILDWLQDLKKNKIIDVIN